MGGSGRRRVVPTARARPLGEYVDEMMVGAGWPLRILWLSTLYAEYRTLLHALWGDRLVAVELVPDAEVQRVGGEAVDELYRRLQDPGCGGGGGGWVEEVVEMVGRALRTGDYDHLLRAARVVNEVVGSRDGWVRIYPYRVVEEELGVSREEAERVVRLGERIASTLSRLGERAEPALRRLIFEGYREGVVDEIEGLDEEERRMLRDLLSRPYDRAALLFAYRHVGNFRELHSRILQEVFHRNTLSYISRSYYIPTIYVLL